MNEAPGDADGTTESGAGSTHGLSLGSALALAAAGAAIALVATIVVLRDEHTVTVDATLAALALVAFSVAAYALIQAVLAVIDSAGERRRHEREVTERRKGERARRPSAP